MNSLTKTTVAAAAAITLSCPTFAEDFESFNAGASINGQGDWTVEDSFGNSGELFDEAIVDLGGNKAWRISNAYTASGYSNQPFSLSSPQIAGEIGAELFNDYGNDHTMPNNPPLSSGTATTRHFHASWDFKSVTGAAQDNISLAVSAGAKQSPLRMTYLAINDTGSGFDLLFYDTTQNGFNGTTVATGLSYTDWHNIEMQVQFNAGEGPLNSGNDLVTISVNGSEVHSGGTWESYFAAVVDGGIPTSAERAVDSLLFRQSGTATPGNVGNGLYIDNVEVTNIPEPTSLALLGLGGLIMARRRRK